MELEFEKHHFITPNQTAIEPNNNNNNNNRKVPLSKPELSNGKENNNIPELS